MSYFVMGFGQYREANLFFPSCKLTLVSVCARLESRLNVLTRIEKEDKIISKRANLLAFAQGDDLDLQINFVMKVTAKVDLRLLLVEFER